MPPDKKLSKKNSTGVAKGEMKLNWYAICREIHELVEPKTQGKLPNNVVQCGKLVKKRSYNYKKHKEYLSKQKARLQTENESGPRHVTAIGHGLSKPSEYYKKGKHANQKKAKSKKSKDNILKHYGKSDLKKKFTEAHSKRR